MPTTESFYKCKKCGDVIPANTNKNLTTCKCGALAVDGCEDYVRFIGDQEDWETVTGKTYGDKTII
jgi:hypothetical protein